MTSSTKLCCMSVGSDSMASDNHTATGKGRWGGGSIKPVYFLCMCGFKQVGMEGGKQQEEGYKVHMWIQLGAFACRCLNRALMFPDNPWGTPQRSVFAPKELNGFMSRWGELGKIFKCRGPECSGSANETVRFTGSVPTPRHQSLTGRWAWDWQGGSRGIAHPQLQVRA